MAMNTVSLAMAARNRSQPLAADGINKTPTAPAAQGAPAAAAPEVKYSPVEAKVVSGHKLEGTGYQLGNLGRTGLADMQNLSYAAQRNRDFATNTANAGATNTFQNAGSLGQW